jgi:bifunctional non-homologous end joining protein LigD
MKVDSHTIELSNRDKVLFPQDDITKGDLIDYYRRMADRILPYLEDRPVMLQRFPDGIAETGFYQKQASDYFPDWITTAIVQPRKEKREQRLFWIICATDTARPRSSPMPSEPKPAPPLPRRSTGKSFPAAA